MVIQNATTQFHIKISDITQIGYIYINRRRFVKICYAYKDREGFFRVWYRLGLIVGLGFTLANTKAERLRLLQQWGLIILSDGEHDHRRSDLCLMP